MCMTELVRYSIMFRESNASIKMTLMVLSYVQLMHKCALITAKTWLGMVRITVLSSNNTEMYTLMDEQRIISHCTNAFCKHPFVQPMRRSERRSMRELHSWWRHAPVIHIGLRQLACAVISAKSEHWKKKQKTAVLDVSLMRQADEEEADSLWPMHYEW